MVRGLERLVIIVGIVIPGKVFSTTCDDVFVIDDYPELAHYLASAFCRRLTGAHGGIIPF